MVDAPPPHEWRGQVKAGTVVHDPLHAVSFPCTTCGKGFYRGNHLWLVEADANATMRIGDDDENVEIYRTDDVISFDIKAMEPMAPIKEWPHIV